MHDKAHRIARPAQTNLQNSGVTGRKLTEFLSDVDGSCSVNARIHAVILPAAVECQQTEWRWGMQFLPIHTKTWLL